MITLVNSGGTNITSIQDALWRLGCDSEVTSCSKKIKSSSKIILPGVGSARYAMETLHKYSLVETIQNLTQPVLGICLGMQLLCRSSEEGGVSLLGIIDQPVKRFPQKPSCPVPHMGWNEVEFSDKKMATLYKKNPYFYFVHSYYVPCHEYTKAICNYGQNFSAVIQKDNFIGAQFHPERSAKDGANLLRYFVEEL